MECPRNVFVYMSVKAWTRKQQCHWGGKEKGKENKNKPYKSLQLISLLISVYFKVKHAELGANSCGQIVYLL